MSNLTEQLRNSNVLEDVKVLEGWWLCEGITRLLQGSKLTQAQADKLHEQIRTATVRTR